MKAETATDSMSSIRRDTLHKHVLKKCPVGMGRDSRHPLGKKRGLTWPY